MERIPEALLNKYKTDIAKQGAFNQDYINRFIKHLKKDRHILVLYEQDIYSYLRDAGFKIA